MLPVGQHNFRRRQKLQSKRSPLVLILLLLVWSLIMGWVMALATSAQPTPTPSDTIGTVDRVPQAYELGQQLYRENCSTCHIAVPPAVLPTQTWQRLLQDSQHYGVQLKPLVDPQRLLVWNYLRTFSRSLNKEGEIPYRIGDSRFFKALHPKVKLPRPLQLSSCATCHPGAGEYNFRNLTPEWENSQ